MCIWMYIYVCMYVYMYAYMYVYIHTYTCTCNGILLSHKKEQNFAICSNMDEYGGHYAKWSKSDRERQILHDITYMWYTNIKNKALVNITKQKQTHG